MKKLKIFNILFVTSIFTSCGVQVGKKQKEENIEILKIGMHRSEVEALLGKPEGVIRDANRNLVYNYSYTRIRSSLKNYIPVVSWFSPTKIHSESQYLTIYFDKDYRIKSFDQMGNAVPQAYTNNTKYQNSKTPVLQNESNFQYTNPSSSINKKQAKKELLNKYLKGEINKEEYYRLLKEIE